MNHQYCNDSHGAAFVDLNTYTVIGEYINFFVWEFYSNEKLPLSDIGQTVSGLYVYDITKVNISDELKSFLIIKGYPFIDYSTISPKLRKKWNISE